MIFSIFYKNNIILYMINKIKRYWKEILIVLLAIMFMNKCTQSCSRATKLDKQNIEIVKKDSIIKQLKSDSTISAIRFEDAKNSNETYRGIATVNQNEMINKIELLSSENSRLKNENNKLKIEIKKLKQK